MKPNRKRCKLPVIANARSARPGSSLMFVLSALLLGFVSGLRTLTAPAAVSWAAHLGLLKLAGTPLAFMGSKYTAIIFTVLAVGELINDKLPKTPSRKTPPQFIARLV